MCNKSILSLSCLLLTLTIWTVEALLPSYIHVCKASDTEINKCILNSIKLLIPKLKEGIEELDVPPLEPLPLDEITLRHGPSSSQVSANVTDIKIWGASNFEIQQMRANVEKHKFSFRVRLPYLYLEGKYDINMQILLFNFKGKGPMTGNFSNYGFDAHLKGNIIQEDGEEHIRFDKMKITIHAGEAKLHLENLFGESKILGRVSDEVLSSNSDLLLNEIRPNLESAIADKFTDISNKMTLRFTYNELFP